MINWTALGEPRMDGSDCLPLLFELGRRPRRKAFSLQDVVKPLDFELKIKHLSEDPKGLPKATSALLQAWPPAWVMAEHLLTGLYPCISARFSDPRLIVGGAYGCRSNDLKDFGQVYATTSSASGFVEGIVCSLANWKLYGIGLKHEQWDVSMFDAPTIPAFPSPLRGESTHAGAIVHIGYCMAHVLSYHLHVKKMVPVPYGTDYSISISRGRLERSVQTIRVLRPSAHGGFAQLLDQFLSWSDRLLRDK